MTLQVLGISLASHKKLIVWHDIYWPFISWLGLFILSSLCYFRTSCPYYSLQRTITILTVFSGGPSGICSRNLQYVYYNGDLVLRASHSSKAWPGLWAYMQVVGGHYWITWLVFWTLAWIQSWWHGPESHCVIHGHFLIMSVRWSYSLLIDQHCLFTIGW